MTIAYDHFYYNYESLSRAQCDQAQDNIYDSLNSLNLPHISVLRVTWGYAGGKGNNPYNTVVVQPKRWTRMNKWPIEYKHDFVSYLKNTNDVRGQFVCMYGGPPYIPFAPLIYKDLIAHSRQGQIMVDGKDM